MTRLKIIDFLTGWGVDAALDEILKTERNREYLREVVNRRKAELYNKADSIQYPANAQGEYPVVSKKEMRKGETIVRSDEKFLSKKTGGSTGEPFQYRVSMGCQGFLWASIIRSWMEVGYRVGDNIAFFAGSSVLGSGFSKAIFYKIMNIIPLNSFGVTDETLRLYSELIKKKNIRFIYGYSNAVYLLAKYVKSNNIDLKLDGIVCTAEQLHDSSRDFIQDALGGRVVRQYGVNDGGLSSFECKYQNGYHIVENRSLVEVVGDSIVSTDLLNDSQLFIRYMVGDRGEVMDEPCSCGLVYPRIINLKGRENDMVKDSKGKVYHSEFFTHYFRKFSSVNQWQVVSEGGDLRINIHGQDICDSMDVIKEEVVDYFSKKSGFQVVEVVFDHDFEFADNGKLKFVLQK